MITFRTTDKNGDSLQKFNEKDPSSFNEAQAVLANLQSNGHIAYKSKDGKHEVVHALTPEGQNLTVVHGLTAG